MGDVYYQIEQLAIAGRLYVTTVNPNKPILPQLPQRTRDRLAGELIRLVEVGLVGQ